MLTALEKKMNPLPIPEIYGEEIYGEEIYGEEKNSVFTICEDGAVMSLQCLLNQS